MEVCVTLPATCEHIGEQLATQFAEENKSNRKMHALLRKSDTRESKCISIPWIEIHLDCRVSDFLNSALSTKSDAAPEMGVG